MATRILFLCTGNACRSQMAEGWLKTLGGDDYEVFSAGLEAHGKNPRAIAVMQEAGVDISAQQSEVIDPELLHGIDLLVTVCGHADKHCPTLGTSGNREHWPFDDPAQASGNEASILTEFRRVRDQIKLRIETFVEERSHAPGLPASHRPTS